MKQALTWLGLGAGLMYYLDPDRGRSRRARSRDWIKHQLNELDEAIEVTTHDLTNRTHGLIARTRSILDGNGDHAPDGVVAARVRSKLGRVVSHPQAIVVTARQGQVVLAGPVPADEVGRLLSAVASVRGVTGVEDRLQVYQQPGDHPALQGGKPRTGEQPELWRKTLSPTMRLLVGTAIGAGALWAVKRGGWAGLALGALGLGMVAHDLTDDRGRTRHRRESKRSGPVLATGAPVHDVAIPFPRSKAEEPNPGL